MASCEGCYHSFGENPNPEMIECRICIRNPKFPTMRQPEEAIRIDGIEIKAPLDMYITRDRKNLEEKKLVKKLMEILYRKGKEEIELLKRRKKKPPEPWEVYWEYANRTKYTA